jgi:hypothetical protein
MELSTARPSTHSGPASMIPNLVLSIVTGTPEIAAESAARGETI